MNLMKKLYDRPLFYLKKFLFNSIEDITSFNFFFYLWGLIKRGENHSIIDSLKNDLVYCIGTGPSLDSIELLKLKNSTIILINSAYKLYSQIDKSNKIVWFSIDTGFIERNYKSVEKEMLKIIIPNSFERFKIFRDIVRNKTIYFHPYIQIRKISKFRLFNFRPKFASFNSNFLKIFGAYRCTILPETAMLNAICFSLSLNCKKIITLGFDSTPAHKFSKPYKYGGGIKEKTNVNTGFNNFKINAYLTNIIRQASQNGVDIINCSPFSHLKSIPKISPEQLKLISVK